MLLWSNPAGRLTTGLLLLLGQTGEPRVHAKLELELSGFGNGWTDVSTDLMDGETVSWGLPDSSPRNRVAETGELHFTLNNSAQNYVQREGAYSPDHANARPGFAEGIRVRYAQWVPGAAQPFVLHVGTLDSIDPDPDRLAGSFAVRCISLDYMDDLARASSSGLVISQNVRDDQMFSSLVAIVPRQPESIETSLGPDTFPIAFDKVENSTRVASVLHDIARSSLSLVYTRGETLVYEPRNVRASKTSSVDTFTTGLVGLEASRNRANRLNRVEVTAHPRKIDPNPTTVLWSLPTPVSAANSIAIPANTSVILWTPYRDPVTQQAIGGLDVVTPVPTTDYLFNSQADGLGSNLTTNIAVGIEKFVSTSKVTYTNTGASGHLVAAQLRGRGIYDYAPTLSQADDLASQVNAGLNILSFDAPYQASIAVTGEIAIYLVNLYKGAATQVNKIRFKIPAHDVALARRILARNISDRISFSESLTGLQTSRNFFINHLQVIAGIRNNLEVEWLLAPADQTAYWLLGVAGRSELDRTTPLGFGLVLGHTDVAHGDTHSDSAHSDSAHNDVVHSDVAHSDVAHNDVAHSDVAHEDAAHADSAHSDVAHSDVAHSDVAHSDAAHSDVAHSDVAHSDVAHADTHSDVAHADSHSDVAHADIAHDDVAHSDVAHSDVTTTIDTVDPPHTDVIAHDDIAHSDVPHSDTHTDAAHADTHSDIAHSDAHTDTAHADLAHTDTAHADSHSDVAHSDTVHTDVTHVDAGHSDAAHADVAHTDTAHADVTHSDAAHADVAHTDVAHSDVGHADSHTDTAHGDIN